MGNPLIDWCKDCEKYNRKTKVCLKNNRYTRRKGTCDEFKKAKEA